MHFSLKEKKKKDREKEKKIYMKVSTCQQNCTLSMEGFLSYLSKFILGASR